MWKDYSISYIKHNRASGISIFVASFITALLLSFLSSLFYNLWVSDVDETIRQEGDWQARIVGELTSEDILTIQNFGNVEKVVVNEELSVKMKKTAVDIYFVNTRTVFQDMPLLAGQLEIGESQVSYHTVLLSHYLIHDPQDETPPLLLISYLILLLIVSLSLILIIRNSFAMSMNARVHQFGIFSSIGATPGQIRVCLIQEAAMLCAIPLLIGSITGIFFSFILNGAMNRLAVTISGAYVSDWSYHPLVFAGTMVSTVLTVLISAWLPARKLSKMTPLEAIRNTGELKLKKKKHFHMLFLLFGIEGELAGNALKAQKKAMRSSTLSLTLSFLGFTVMLCFFTLSGISTKHTYFEKYQNAWDVMATIKDTEVEDFTWVQKLRELSGVQNLLAYQKTETVSLVPSSEISEEVRALGGPQAIAGASVSADGDFWKVKTPVIILDDRGFLEYCCQSGISPGLEGTIILNRIWDSVNSNFRYKNYIPFVIGKQENVVLQSIKQEGEAVEVPVLGFADEAPVLREEYENYALVQFMPVSLWNTISGQVDQGEADMYVRILAEERNDLSTLNTLQNNVEQILASRYEIEIENRIQEKITNDRMIFGYQLLLGGLCFVLALIGIANIFANTLGFLRQRKREFAQYMSVGMTPKGMQKMFCAEALMIAGKPLLITVPLTAVSVGFMIRLSYLDPMEFMAVAPVLPILMFFLVIVFSVALAYYLGGKKLLHVQLADALRDDTLG